MNKWKLPLILFLVLAFIGTVWAAQKIRIKDSTGSYSVDDVEITQTSGVVTIANATEVDFGSADITTTGSVSGTGTPSWSLTANQNLDDGSGDSPYWGCIDGSSEQGYIYKIDSSHLAIFNDTAADGIAFLAGNDTDDYAYFSTTSNVPYLKTAGSAQLWIEPDGDTTVISSDNSDSTLKVRGYEAKEARLILSADEDDDATDSFQFDVSTAGVLSIGNDNTVADTFVDLLTLSSVGDANLRGTTPFLTIGDTDAEDLGIVFDGNAQDFHIGLDDTADDLIIGLGTALGTTPALAIDENQVCTFYQDPIFSGTTPAVTIGDAGAEDSQLNFDGNAQDFSIGIDDTDDTLNFCLGTTLGTTERFKISSSALNVIFGDASAADVYNTFDGNAEDYYVGIDDSSDDFVIGRGSTVGTDIRLSILNGAAVQHIKIGDAAAEDMILSFDGNAQDFHIALDDSDDSLEIGFGTTVETDERITINGSPTETIIEIGDAATEDMRIEFDGNAVNYHLALDDSSDDFIIGLGSTIATTEFLTFLNDSFIIVVGDASAADAGFKIDGNAQDFYVAIDDTDDTLQLGLGGTPGTTERVKISSSALNLIFGDATEADVYNTFDGNAHDYYYGIDDSSDDFIIGYGSTVGTDIRLSILEGGTVQHVKIGDAAAEDMILSWDGNAQDFAAGLDDSSDSLLLQNGTTLNNATAAIAINSSQVVTLTQPLNLAGMNQSVVTVTDAAEYDVLAANTGKIHVITDLAQNTSIDLPAEAAGLFYTFIYAGGADEAHDHTIDSENNTNFFIGGVAYADTDAGAGGDEINAGIYSDGNSNSKLTINNASAGTVVTVFSDGTNWYVSGRVFSDTAPAFADQ